MRIGARARFVTIGDSWSRCRLNGYGGDRDDGFDGHVGSRRRSLFHCGTVEHRREQKTAADHQPADHDTTFHDEIPLVNVGEQTGVLHTSVRRVLVGSRTVMCPLGQPDRLAKAIAGSHNHLRR